jgi:MFS family permease
MFGDWLGRRRSIILGALVMMIGVVIQVSAMVGYVPLAQFCVGRVVTGVGNGMNTSTIPTYQAGTFNKCFNLLSSAIWYGENESNLI